MDSVDPTALALKRAIFKAEGGDYSNTGGDNGTSAGAGQWNNGKLPLKQGEIPARFKSDAQSVGLDPNDFSETNQDHVGYSVIKKKLDAGQSQSSIAAEWNSGLTSGWENHVGDTMINGKTIHYDTPAYVDKVQKYYEENQPSSATSEGNSQSPSSQTNGNPNSNGFITSANLPAETPQQPKSNDLLNNPVTRGIETEGNFLTGGGAGQLGNEVGSSLATGYEKLKGLLGGQDNSKYIPSPNVGKALGAGAKSIVGAGLTGAVELVSGLVKGGSALASEPVVSELTNYATKTKSALKDLSAAEKVNVLTEALGKAEAGVKPLFSKALSELAPQVLREAGVGSFSDLNPKTAKALGIGAKALKNLIGVVAAGAGFGEGQKLVSGILK